MNLRERVVGFAIYWGLVKHPFGRWYAHEHYTPTGRRRVSTDE